MPVLLSKDHSELCSQRRTTQAPRNQEAEMLERCIYPVTSLTFSSAFPFEMSGSFKALRCWKIKQNTAEESFRQSYGTWEKIMGDPRYVASQTLRNQYPGETLTAEKGAQRFQVDLERVHLLPGDTFQVQFLATQALCLLYPVWGSTHSGPIHMCTTLKWKGFAAPWNDTLGRSFWINMPPRKGPVMQPTCFFKAQSCELSKQFHLRVTSIMLPSFVSFPECSQISGTLGGKVRLLLAAITVKICLCHITVTANGYLVLTLF